MDGLQIQHELFQLIKKKANDPKNWIDEIAGVLSISKPAVYKRINGSTSLSLDDVARLMTQYNISFDKLVLPVNNSISFSFPYLEKEIKSFPDYVVPLRNTVEQLSKVPEIKVWYATNELPFFYYFFFPDLTYFKFYMYARTVWNIPSYQNMKINLREFSGKHALKNDIEAIQTAYYTLPGIEFWNENVLNNTLNQIVYFLSSNCFEIPQEAFVLCDRLSSLIQHATKMAERGRKFSFGKSPEENSPEFSMYYNEIAHTNNIALIRSPYANSVIAAYDNPNIIMSNDERLLKYTSQWFERVKKSSQNISLDSQKARLSFFARIERRINQTRSEIESIISRF